VPPDWLSNPADRLGRVLSQWALAETALESPVQFERQGYFCPDDDSTPDKLVFNRSIQIQMIMKLEPSAPAIATHFDRVPSVFRGPT
jgi:hypothetical protein